MQLEFFLILTNFVFECLLEILVGEISSLKLSNIQMLRKWQLFDLKEICPNLKAVLNILAVQDIQFLKCSTKYGFIGAIQHLIISDRSYQETHSPPPTYKT